MRLSCRTGGSACTMCQAAQPQCLPCDTEFQDMQNVATTGNGASSSYSCGQLKSQPPECSRCIRCAVASMSLKPLGQNGVFTSDTYMMRLDYDMFPKTKESFGTLPLTSSSLNEYQVSSLILLSLCFAL
ncbi:hypothetical protein M440DRAFT_251296 [Trichoderma longibrachiatum ATCC 18648]|uniref:Uncharacterized protein n=1 Tax=Trichoderma longibrachiatum ATCC 18648 TaxID=983965 RepID=A0A2T4C8Z0_TRILO|nr:hypothetical protein M440DRAFT_251296 [Trichoderma longibrachiatum ATCC 18648]